MQTDKLIVITDHYRPARASGGIVTALENILGELACHKSILVITKNNDLGSKTPLVQDSNKWKKQGRIRVNYSLSLAKLYFLIYVLLNTRNTNFYFPSFFSPLSTILPLIILKLRTVVSPSCNINVCVAASGQLYETAVARKRLKKRAFFKISSLIGLYNNTTIIYSSDLERNSSVLNEFKHKTKSVIVPNFLSKDKYYRNINSTRLNRDFLSNEEQINLLFVGRIHRIKRIEAIIEHIKAAKFKKKVIINICGLIEDESYWRELTSSVKKLSEVNVQIEYHGLLDEEALSRSYRNADCLCLLSETENYSYVVPEALSCGCPVIISDGVFWSQFEEDCITILGASMSLEANIVFREKVLDIIKNKKTYAAKCVQFIEEYIGGSQQEVVRKFLDFYD